jgi:signal peptidase I
MRESPGNAEFMHIEPKTVVNHRFDAPQDSEHSLKCELAAQVVRSFGILRLEVTGLSMLPSVRPGDILFIERRDMREIAAGDVVLFARQGKLVAHRVRCKATVGGVLHAITRGDALLSPDDPVSPTELLGSVRHILRAGTHVEISVDSSLWARMTSKLVQHFAWIALLLAFMYRLQSDTRRRETLCEI